MVLLVENENKILKWAQKKVSKSLEVEGSEQATVTTVPLLYCNVRIIYPYLSLLFT